MMFPGNDESVKFQHTPGSSKIMRQIEVRPFHIFSVPYCIHSNEFSKTLRNEGQWDRQNPLVKSFDTKFGVMYLFNRLYFNSSDICNLCYSWPPTIL